MPQDVYPQDQLAEVVQYAVSQSSILPQTATGVAIGESKVKLPRELRELRVLHCDYCNEPKPLGEHWQYERQMRMCEQCRQEQDEEYAAGGRDGQG